jgi:hypothetical protein
MSERIMKENLEHCLQISEQELDSVVGGAVPYQQPGKPYGYTPYIPKSGLPLPRGGGVAAGATSASTIATILASLAI